VRGLLVTERAKELRLPFFTIALQARAVFAGLVDADQEPRP